MVTDDGVKMTEKNKFLFVTDLDRTIIHSSKFLNNSIMDSIQCVESDGIQNISFILTEALQVQQALSEFIHFVPVTTRSRVLFDRIRIFKDIDYAIVENGATILYRGEVLSTWEHQIKQYLLEGDFSRKLSRADSLLTHSDYAERGSVRHIGDKFVMCKTDCPDEMERSLSEELNKDDFHYTIQGRKVYVIPRGITKENAVSFLEGILETTYTFASGDGMLDLGMLLQADTAYVPSDAELLKRVNTDHLDFYVSPYDSFNATLDILKKVKEDSMRLLSTKNT